MPMNFRFRWVPFMAAVVVATVGIMLGQWQTRRAVEKEVIQEKLVARAAEPLIQLRGASYSLDDMEYRRVLVRGGFIRDWPVYLDNRPYKGMAGFHVLMPMKIVGTDTYVLVIRGWARRDVSDRTLLPPVETPSGVVEIEGLVRRDVGHVLQLGEIAPLRPHAIVQNAEVADFAEAGKWSMLPFVIEQTSALQDGLVRDWPQPASGAEKHRGYAFQWYALAATALIFFVVTGFKRGSK